MKHFVDLDMNVLVLGRKHMERWPSQYWGYVANNTDTFLADSLSQDDPYFLYCALHSGLNTIIVTRDLMRSHKFKLKDPVKKILFNRWIGQCRYEVQHITAVGKVYFKVSRCYC